MTFTISDVVRVQRDLDIADHVVYLHENGFVMAHTDWEREHLSDLTRCMYHYWLSKLDSQEWIPYLWVFPQVPGWYRLPNLLNPVGIALLGEGSWGTCTCRWARRRMSVAWPRGDAAWGTVAALSHGRT